MYGYNIPRIGGVPSSLSLFVKNRATPLFCIFHGKTTLSLRDSFRDIADRIPIPASSSFPRVEFIFVVTPLHPPPLRCQSDVFIFSGNGIILAKEIDLD